MFLRLYKTFNAYKKNKHGHFPLYHRFLNNFNVDRSVKR